MSTTSPQDADARPIKRMRNSTRSCTECRRRKVRCIFESDNQICKECISHDSVCIRQRAQLEEASPLIKSQSALEGIKDLSGIVEKSGDAIVHNSGSQRQSMPKSNVIQPERHASIISHLGPAGSPQFVENIVSTTHIGSGPRNEEPLVRYLQEGLPMQIHKVQDDGEEVNAPSTLTVLLNTDYTEAVLAYIPNITAVTSILEATQSNWRRWQTFPDEFFSSDTLGKSSITHARNFIFRSLTTADPVVISRALLCLTLCIQQLPRDFDFKTLELTTSSEELQSIFLSAAATLLTEDKLIENLIGLECLLVQAKLYLHLGKPRKVWTINRRAVTTALLLRLNHPTAVEGLSGEQLWSQIWQRDRQISMVLGLPYAVSDAYIAPPVEGDEEVHRALRLMRSISVITGKVIDRDRNIDHVNYSVTLQIEQELDRSKLEMPSIWWESTPDPNIPAELSHGHYVIKIFWHFLRKQLHLPYVLKSFSDNNYESSRVAALESARAMMNLYPYYKSSSGIMMCNFLDFQIFSAAIVVVLCLLNSSKTHSRNFDEEARDWILVHNVTTALKSLSSSVHCTVGSQAASLLEKLSEAHRGSMETVSYSTAIPYFGTFRITKVASALATPVETWSNGTETHSQASFLNTIEFGADPLIFADIDQSETPWFWSDAELGMNWGTAVDPDYTYAWNWHFNCTDAQAVDA